MLPPRPSPKRDIGVNIRFNALEYERLKRIADYRGLPVTTLLHYVIERHVLPRLEREMEKEQRPSTAPTTADALEGADPDWLDTPHLPD